MPTLSLSERVLLSFSTATAAEVATFNTTRYPLPLADLIIQAASDRLGLAGRHLATGDAMILNEQYRSAISRHYYAMYHAARAIVFAHVSGDDHERHSTLPRHLPPSFPDVIARRAELNDARALRNQADYDIYPLHPKQWEGDSRTLAPIAAQFVGICEQYALEEGLI